MEHWEWVLEVIFKMDNMQQINRSIVNPYLPIIRSRILQLIEKGIIPWRQGFSPHGVARIYLDNRSITGISWLLCNFTTDYPLPYYLHWKQLKDMGGSVQKNTKAEFIYYLKEKKWQRFPVYNISCINGIAIQHPCALKKEQTIYQRIDQWITPLLHVIPTEDSLSRIPKWNPLKETIKLPINKNLSTTYYWYLFKALLAYIANTINDPFIPNVLLFDTYALQKQELICELGATYLCGYFGLFTPPVIENHSVELLDWQYHIYRYPEMLSVSILGMKYLVNLLFEKQRAYTNIKIANE